MDPILRDPGYLKRLSLTMFAGVFVSLFLTWFMFILIESGDRNLDESERIHLADFVRIKQTEQSKIRERPPERPKPVQAPPVPEAANDNNPFDGDSIQISDLGVEKGMEITDGFSFGASEGEYLPIVKVAPIYPIQASSKKIEGYCVVIYTVTNTGTVKDVSVVEDRCTSRYFYRSSVKAAYKFKYKPRVIDGEAIEVPGVMNRFIYELVDNE